MADPIVITGADGTQVYANRAARDLRADLGAMVADLPLGDLESGAVAADGERLPEGRLPTQFTRLTGRPCTQAEIGLPTAVDGVRWLRVSTRRLHEDGPPFEVVSSYSRVPELRGALRAQRGGDVPAHRSDGATRSDPVAPTEVPALLPHALEHFSTAFSKAPIGMALVSPEGRWLQVNQAMCDLVGYSEPELLSLSFPDITHPDDLEAQLPLQREVLTGRRSSYQLDKRYRHADGHVIWVSISVSLVRDDSGEPLHQIAQVLDITDRHELEQRLQHLADHDPLTGVLNRRRFEEELIRQIDRCRRYGEQATLVMIDLDRFKQVNDGGGHGVGDEVLKSVAAVLLANVRSSDVFARLGGDEFAAILVGVGSEQALASSAALAAVVRDHDAAGVRTTTSIGATVLGSDDRPDAALFRADEAMYRVKSAGRDGAQLR